MNSQGSGSWNGAEYLMHQIINGNDAWPLMRAQMTLPFWCIVIDLCESIQITDTHTNVSSWHWNILEAQINLDTFKIGWKLEKREESVGNIGLREQIPSSGAFFKTGHYLRALDDVLVSSGGVTFANSGDVLRYAGSGFWGPRDPSSHNHTMQVFSNANIRPFYDTQYSFSPTSYNFPGHTCHAIKVSLITAIAVDTGDLLTPQEGTGTAIRYWQRRPSDSRMPGGVALTAGNSGSSIWACTHGYCDVAVTSGADRNAVGDPIISGTASGWYHVGNPYGGGGFYVGHTISRVGCDDYVPNFARIFFNPGYK
jgi:hypothetical protein